MNCPEQLSNLSQLVIQTLIVLHHQMLFQLQIYPFRLFCILPLFSFLSFTLTVCSIMFIFISFKVINSLTTMNVFVNLKIIYYNSVLQVKNILFNLLFTFSLFIFKVIIINLYYFRFILFSHFTITYLINFCIFRLIIFAFKDSAIGLILI